MLDPEDIKRMRTRMRLTQDGLAELMGVHRRTVQSWETPVVKQNHRSISAEHEEKLRQLHESIFKKVRQES